MHRRKYTKKPTRLDIRDLDHLYKCLRTDKATIDSILSDQAKFFTPRRKRKTSGGYRQYYALHYTELEDGILIKSKYRQLLVRINDIIRPVWLEHIQHCTGPKNIRSAAQQHTNQKFVINFDIKNCFPSISRARVKDAFIRIGCSLEVSECLSRLTTYKGKLAQGFPPSSQIANIILKPLARRLFDFALKNGLQVTLYVDDITFSGGNNLPRLRKKINEIVNQEHFQLKNIHPPILSQADEQVVLGCKVNRGLDLPDATINHINADIESLKNQWYSPGSKAYHSYVGLIDFIQFINKSKGEIIRQHFNEAWVWEKA